MEKQNQYPRLFIVSIVLAAFVSALAGCSSNTASPNAPSGEVTATNRAAETPKTSSKPALGVPAAISAEHRELHEELEAAVKSGGKTGEAARLVEERLSVHFEKEEQFALPQLGLLADLAEGKFPEDARKAAELSDKLKADLPKMLEEHKGIVEALEKLKKAATEENKPAAAAFAEKLSAHAQNEEQVMYPAAILVGEFVKLKLGSK